jgi:hypothetical protein
MPARRAADVLYNSEAALRLVVRELGELHPRITPAGTKAQADEARQDTTHEAAADAEGTRTRTRQRL